MDPNEREIALRRLAAAEEVLARTRGRAARQREIVAELEAAGHDPTQARRILGTFEATQALHERRLALLLDELSQSGWKQVAP